MRVPRSSRIRPALVAGVLTLAAAGCAATKATTGGAAAAPEAAQAGEADEAAPGREDPSASVVPIGYGTQHRRDVTGAIGSISARDLENQRVTRVEELIEGRVAGVRVLRRSNGELSLRVRGSGSIYNSGEPLYVVDGMPIQNGGLMSAVAGLAPQDIARIEVLKDAGSTAIYGVQGANGVILITTKRGR
jgi:TonB-dependent SusC/RagA subfamily outer membrane receptor